jgi:hypothetical protein
MSVGDGGSTTGHNRDIYRDMNLAVCSHAGCHSTAEPGAVCSFAWSSSSATDGQGRTATVTVSPVGCASPATHDVRVGLAPRTADRMDPIEVVIGDPHRGRQRIVGRLQPPRQPRGDLDTIEFGLRELAS